MFKTSKEMGLSQKEIDEIVERLLKERELLSDCPDCGVAPGKIHEGCCDVARCTKCGSQYISCDCEDPMPDVWSGLWPGLKECYEQKLICFDTCVWPDTKNPIGWCFDLNELAIRK